MTIVLMHGFGAFMHLFAGRSIRPMVEALAVSGHDFHAPMVQPYDRVPERAAQWMDHFSSIRSTSPGPLHLIGFSSGGLDARYLITRLGGHEFVASLTTVSTPHRGSSLADYILERPAAMRDSIIGLADWMGDRLPDPRVSDSRRALEELTTSYMVDVYNPATPDHPDTRYVSWAGRAGKGTTVPILPLLRIANRIVFDRQGPNDGIVSVSSAAWSGFRGTIDADHARQIGLKAFNGSFDAAEFVASLVEDLEPGQVEGSVLSSPL